MASHVELESMNMTAPTAASEEEDKVMVAKMTAMAVLGLASLCLGLLPLRLASWLNWGVKTQRKPGGPAAALHSHDSPAGGGILLSLLLCFGGGVLMCTTFVHMLPEVQESFEELEEHGRVSGSMAHIAPHLLMCAGFFVMYLVEELVHLYLHWRSHKHENGHGHSHGAATVPTVTAVPSEEIKKSPITSLTWASRDEKPSTVVMEYADGSSANSEIPPQYRVSTVTFSSKAQAGDRKYIKVDAERPSTKGVHRVAKSSKCHKVHHDHQEPDLDIAGGNMPDFMTGANHHSHAIPAGSGAHSHEEDSGEEDSVVSAMRGLLIVLALSVHELFEGLAVGLEGSAMNVWYMLAAVACHKLVIAFCIGVELVAMKTKVPFHFLYVATFALVSPLGIGVGIIVTSKYSEVESGLVPAVLQGLATGTLLYVVFFEILERQRSCGHSGVRQYMAVLLGFLLMFGMSFIGGHEHGHSHGHGHSHEPGHEHVHTVLDKHHYNVGHSH